MIDRTLLAHEQREKWLAEKAHKLSVSANVLVWVLSPEGRVFGSAIPMFQLGENGITSGTHQGLLWWPYQE